MASEVRTVVISGYYGFNNSGDEAVLNSILNALERAGREAGIRIEPVVLSGDPAATTALYGVRAVHRMKIGEVRRALKNSHALISGGGSLLQDATSAKTIPYYLGVIKLAQWLGKPTFIYAQGIGPVQRKLFYPFIKNVFSRSAYVSVRDVESAALLEKMGLNKSSIEVVPDPVMGMRLPSGTPQSSGFDEEGRPIVGVSVRFWNEDRTDMDRIAEMLQQWMEQQQLHIRFLPFHGHSDEAASRYVMDRLSNVDKHGSAVSISPIYPHPLDMLKEVSRCRVLVGMRLHSLIYAASQQVPVLGISYDPKIDQFLNRLGEQAIGTTKQLHPQRAAEQASSVLSNTERWREQHQEVIQQLIQEAELPAKQVVQLLRQTN
ncbi:polysaccharide pyruvyl transferase CsaB [Paenibacillus sp. SC116]|uniref:polysaccharide pyruvyl transferase CsaB n=1 Tax=Paenibacillus sp. SC116 TaxID=2968986 RepID=UPI00215A7946|nr:polysaccharide pyruvyl transferase CsaB [Paenibacillus sp. SC116]MCR8844780.1 polysaccharide pyruvyl transferase CsaB [Paenibacillus sp. SC116]